MEIKNLSTTNTDQVIDCFLSAFEGYFVKMPADKSYYQERWRRSKVNFELSHGAFDHGRLVAFILHATDFRNGKHLSYNAGTGVIPEYRGRKLVKSIYGHAVPELKSAGISRSILEVITENDKAIKAYERVGFRVTKTLRCYKGQLNLPSVEDVEIKSLDPQCVPWEKWGGHQTWDNQKEALLNGSYSYCEVWHNGKPESYLALDKNNGHLARFGTYTEVYEGMARLFTAVRGICAEIKVNNLDAEETEKNAFLKKLGLENYVNQYEMELELANFSPSTLSH